MRMMLVFPPCNGMDQRSMPNPQSPEHPFWTFVSRIGTVLGIAAAVRNLRK
jgi:hypothetical protein